MGSIRARLLVVMLLVQSLVAVGVAVARTSDAPVTPARRVMGDVAVHPPAATPIPARPPAGAAVGPETVLGGRPACALVVAGGRELLAHEPDAALVPASTLKLFTAAAALEVLGPHHRFVTSVVAPAPPAGGVVERLWIVGGGDPLLATPGYASSLASKERWAVLPITPLDELADRIVEAGVGVVRGGIHADESRHSTERFVETWPARFRAQLDITPMSALTVDRGLATWDPTPTAAEQPALRAAEELARLLRDRGVVVEGEVSVGGAPAGARMVAAIDSAPVREIAAATLQASDNVAAELLLREVGVAAAGEGSTAAGLHAMTRVVRALGVTAAFSPRDGSGLDYGSRVSCRALVQVLSARPGGTDLSALLAVAGRTGTLRKRFVGSALEGRLRAKTGWIAGVVGIAGSIDGAVVAVLQNDVPGYRDGMRAEEALLAGSL